MGSIISSLFFTLSVKTTGASVIIASGCCSFPSPMHNTAEVAKLSATSVLGSKISCADEKFQVNFFYGDGCPHCAKVEPVIDELETKFPQVLFNNYEIYHNQNNALLLYKFYDEYQVPQEYRGGVPIVFVGDEYFLGDSPIIDNLENRIIEKFE